MTSAAPAAVRAHVNNVPRSACTIGERSFNIVPISLVLVTLGYTVHPPQREPRGTVSWDTKSVDMHSVPRTYLNHHHHITTTTTVAATDTFITVTITAEYWRCYRHFTTTNVYSRLLRGTTTSFPYLSIMISEQDTQNTLTRNRTTSGTQWTRVYQHSPLRTNGVACTYMCTPNTFTIDQWPFAISNGPIRQWSAWVTCTRFELR